MGLRTYKVTKAWVTLARKLFGFELRVTGTENLPDRPTMFVSNHFTRVETFLTPYVLYLHTGKQVRSLATHKVFHGLLGKYLELLGAMSTKTPRRNRIIIQELLTGRDNWLIYPEGGLVKNKKTIQKGKLHIERPSREGPPHTGAALMALKVEIIKRKYLKACEKGDVERMKFYEKRYNLKGPEDVCREGIVVVPVNLTFYPLRPGNNFFNRLARHISGNIDPRLEEELLVEGRIIAGGSEVIIHFGEPMEVSDYLDRPTHYARKLVGMFSEMRGKDLALGRQATKLTGDSMRSIYESTEINLDHLFCYGLHALNRERIVVDDFHRAMYIAACELARNDEIRVHPSLNNGIATLVGGGPYWPLDSVVEMAREAGILQREGDEYLINLEALNDEHDFHQIRLKNPVRVIANEMMSHQPVVTVMNRILKIASPRLRQRTARTLIETDRHRFEQEYQRWADTDIIRARELGEPFFLDSKNTRVGIVFTHGYLGCPEQMRPMAEYFNNLGYCVYGVRLAGHGTSPNQLPHVTWKDWMDSVMHGYATMRQQCDKVVLAGFSLGGIISLLVAANQGRAVDGLVSINAPLRLRDRRMPLIPTLIRWNTAKKWLGLTDGHTFWNNHTESPGLNYDHHYLEAVSEIRRAVATCKKDLKRVTAPVLVMQSEDDPMVAKDSGRLLLAGLRSPMKAYAEMPFERHLIVRGGGSEQVFLRMRRFIDRIIPEEAATASDHRRSA